MKSCKYIQYNYSMPLFQSKYIFYEDLYKIYQILYTLTMDYKFEEQTMRALKISKEN